MRRLYILVVLVLFLGGYALAAHRMETVRTEGKTILLALAPVDPRAPLMGDYMALRYAVNNDIRKALAAQKNAQKNAQEHAPNATQKSAQKEGQKMSRKLSPLKNQQSPAKRNAKSGALPCCI